MNSTNTNTCADITHTTRKLHIDTPNNYAHNYDTACVDLSQEKMGEIDGMHNAMAAQGRHEIEYPAHAKKLTEQQTDDFYREVGELEAECHRLYNWAAYP